MLGLRQVPSVRVAQRVKRGSIFGRFFAYYPSMKSFQKAVLGLTNEGALVKWRYVGNDRRILLNFP